MTASTFLFRIIAIAAILMMTFGSTQPVYATPNNDNFANAIRIDNLPAEIYTDTVGATFEADEPYPECAYGDPVKTVWYTYTPMESATLRLSYHYEALAVYKGASLDSLTPVRCINGWSDGGAFPAEAGVTYYLQLSTYADEENIGLWLYLAPPPSVELSVWPEEPSIYDDYVTFRGYVWDDPGEVYDGSCLWTLWDGTTLSDCYFTYKFTKDGDYPLGLLFTTTDNRTAETNTTVKVRTRDIAITKFSTPLVARVNQTKVITVEITNKLYPEEVEVYLYKGLPGDSYQLVGYLTMQVPARPNRPTLFKFSYNFTAADAAIGNVTFRAEATIINGRDALPTDNLAVRTVLVK